MYSDLSIESYNSIAILSEDRDTIVKSKDTEDRILFLIDKLTNKTKNYFVDNDSKSLISYVDIDQPQWRIIYCIPVKELYSEINELRITIMLLVIISILVLSILSSFTAIDILNPINKLITAMKKLDNDRKHTKLDVKRNDEIGYLMKTFNTMSYNIDYLVNVNYREKLTRKEAQIKLLKVMILLLK